jgi:S-formylglutathione hydrolase FrmB
MGQLIAMVDDLSRRILGDQASLANSSNDLPALAQALASSKKDKPEFFTACGKKDFLYPLHHQMVGELTELGFTLTNYEEENAYHEWSFWDKAIQIALDWMEIS